MNGLRSFVCFACVGLILTLAGCGGTIPEEDGKKIKVQDQKEPSRPEKGPNGEKIE